MSGSITIPINLNDCNRSTIRTNSPSGEEDSGKSCGPGRPSHWGMSPFIYCCPLRAWGHAVGRSSPALLHRWSVSLRLILQRLGTCYHWHSIIQRPVSDQLIQQNLDFLPITTCISVIPPTLPSLWCSDTWMPCATLDTLSLRLLLACGEISVSLSVSAALKALLQQLTCPGVTQVRSVPGMNW